MVLLLSENNKKRRLLTRVCFMRKGVKIIFDLIATCALFILASSFKYVRYHILTDNPKEKKNKTKKKKKRGIHVTSKKPWFTVLSPLSRQIRYDRIAGDTR